MAPASGTTAKPKTGSAGRATLLLLALAVPVLLAVAAPQALVLLAGALLPTLAALMMDRTRERHAAFAVGVLNLVGAAPFVFDLLGPRATMATAMAALGDPFALGAIYGAAAVGWALVLAAPPAARIWLAIVTERRLAQLRRLQEVLVEVWGVDVAGEPEAPPRR